VFTTMGCGEVGRNIGDNDNGETGFSSPEMFLLIMFLPLLLRVGVSL
jgi:hypothetical protein